MSLRVYQLTLGVIQKIAHATAHPSQQILHFLEGLVGCGRVSLALEDEGVEVLARVVEVVHEYLVVVGMLAVDVRVEAVAHDVRDPRRAVPAGLDPEVPDPPVPRRDGDVYLAWRKNAAISPAASALVDAVRRMSAQRFASAAIAIWLSMRRRAFDKPLAEGAGIGEVGREIRVAAASSLFLGKVKAQENFLLELGRVEHATMRP